jgi:hypothetical protein
MGSQDSVRSHLGVLAAYAAVAIVFTWPLALHLSTHLTGTPGGDTGAYVWNQWVFRHELVDHHAFPYFTHTLFGAGSPANLSLHNYTTFQNLLALPLIPLVGLIAAFNLVYLLMTTVTAYVTYLLARQATGGRFEAWLAGLLFAWSPVLVTRGMGHFSLVAAAPLALFLLLLTRRPYRFGAAAALAMGATLWWAASTDVYYAVYCVLIAIVVFAAEMVAVTRVPARRLSPRVLRTLDVVLVGLAALVCALAVSGGWEWEVLGTTIRMRTLYNPMMAFTCLAILRMAWHYRIAIDTSIDGPQLLAFGRVAVAAGLFCAVLLSPVLYAASLRIAEGDFNVPHIFWRSSPPGLDLIALVVPNPNHPLAPASIARWLTTRPDGYLENVGSIPWTLVAIIAAAIGLGWRAPRRWLALAAVFGLLALGPFITVMGVSTSVPGPWAFLRYVPVVGLARSPARFAIVMLLALSVLCAAALVWIGQRYPRHRRRMLTALTVVALFELWPAPRPLYSAAVPNFYRHVAAAPDGSAILELPFGVRDGTSSVGNFTARSQFFQTAHGRTLMGGYLSRIARRRVADLERTPVLYALALLSENRPLPPELASTVRQRAPAFLHEKRVNYVVIDRARSSAALASLAVDALRLDFVEAEGGLELYRVR